MREPAILPHAPQPPLTRYRRPPGGITGAAALLLPSSFSLTFVLAALLPLPLVFAATAAPYTHRAGGLADRTASVRVINTSTITST